MKNNGIQLPANCTMLNNEEMTCIEGGGIVASICYAFGQMFKGVHWDKWESESKALEEKHGAVVSQKGNVYTYADGYTHTMSSGSSFGMDNVGNFFNGLGDLFLALGL